ncbi:MAG: hypothetical protein LBT11_03295 [Treponema sp.]|nr:hypothetical protein [Treponema sp.]
MKKFVLIGLLILAGTSMLAAQIPADGWYFTQDNLSSNPSNPWAAQMVVQVQGGKVAYVNWNYRGILSEAKDRKTAEPTGAFTTVAKTLEAYLLANPTDLNVTKVSSVADAQVKAFYDLVKRALAAAPVAKGIYKGVATCGWYYGAASAQDSYGTRNTVLITLVNGTIVDVVWNGILNYPGMDHSKLIVSMQGGYPMTGAKQAWHVQAVLGARKLVEVQDPAKITVKSNGTTDAISGASILVKDFLAVATQVLAPLR